MILLVEDDEDVREMLELAFRSNGYPVESACDGAGALAVLERGRPCLIILDLVMPMMTGWEVIAQMKQKKLGDIPVCVISALGGSVPAQAIASFCKPFDVRELVALASRYCAHARAAS